MTEGRDGKYGLDAHAANASRGNARSCGQFTEHVLLDDEVLRRGTWR